MKDGDMTKEQLINGLAERRQRVAELEKVETKHKRAEEQVLRQSAVLRAINKVFQETLTCETEEQLGRTCLGVAQGLTGSKFGFICEVNKAGRFDTIAISDPGWDACRIPKTNAVLMLKDLEIRGIRGRVVKDERSMIFNNPASHPDWAGTPEGHPRITCFLGVPLKHAGRTIGMIGLANKESCYYPADQEAVETLSVAIVEALNRKRAEEALKEYSERLEEIVEERTKELRDAHEELIRRERLATLGQLAGGVGHELRNPLGVIKNSAYFLNLTEADEKIKKHLAIIDREVDKANKIISDLLNFSRVKPLERSLADINDLIRHTLGHLPIPPEVRVTCRLASRLPPLLLDQTQIGQVFANIVSNALEAMPQGGRLKVETRKEDESVVVSFTDTGSGIPKENLGKIFQPLFTTKAQGIGLGLAICKNLVEAHGGKIWAESEGEMGSTFHVSLPCPIEEEPQ